MEILEATICSFEAREKTDRGYRYVINSNDYHKIICIQDEEEIVDINNMNRYHQLKKDISGFILKEEFGKIELGVEYVTNTRLLEPREININTLVKAKTAKMQCKKQQKVLKR